MKDLKIIGLQISDLRKISAINMEFTNKGLIQIRGGNQQGKSTLLDAIEILIRGKKFTPTDIIQHGKQKARIIGQVGEYKIERLINQKGQHTIKISGADGKQVTTTPQSFLDAMINDLTFDPKPFINKTSDQKLKFMMDLLDLDLTSIDAELKEKETERTLVGREVKSFGDLPILAKVDPVDVTEVMKEKEIANQKNNDIDRGNEKSKELTEILIVHLGKINELKNQLIIAENTYQEIKESKKIVDDALVGLGEPIDTTELDNKIEGASEINRQSLAYYANQDKQKQLIERETEYTGLTDDITKLRTDKEALLNAAPMPIKGLQIREDGVYFDKIHSDNWSDSQSMKISFDLCVALKPNLKAVFIDRGESFDQEQLANLDVWAKKNNIQAFITIVDSGNVGDVDGAIYIEEGEIIS